jgi:hypothetical protein
VAACAPKNCKTSQIHANHTSKSRKAGQNYAKSHQVCKNGLGLLSKTHTLTPPRQAISLLALAAIGVRTYVTAPK